MGLLFLPHLVGADAVVWQSCLQHNNQ